ncbi:MAG: sulfotransferase [Alphaproteobacteria bacterium]|nr:sulfotransferase [Alphaproteobacteria bacterium]
MRQPLIVLTCMRSYSSLVCGMLGQHPDLYGMPELNLFVGETVGAVIDVLTKIRPRSLDGLYRAVAEIECGGQDALGVERAIELTRQRRAWPAKRMLDHLGEAVAPRIWVDKSPSTVVNERALENALRFYPDAHYLHLTRHPRPTCESIHTITAKNVAPKRGRRPATGKNEPERLWQRMNGDIVRLAGALTPGQYMHVRGEDILGDPHAFLRQICEWLDIRDDDVAIEAMLHPEESPYAGIGPAAAPFGNDPNFLRNPHFTRRPIPAASLEGPLSWRGDGGVFEERTAWLARRFGYA